MATPMMPPPGGDENRAPGFIACVAITTFAAFAIVCLRLYVRARIVRLLGWDDWVMVLAMIFALLTAAFDGLQASHGFGRHEFYLSPQQRSQTIKYSVLGIVVVVLGSCCSKVSVCLFALRLLKDASATKRRMFLFTCIGILLVGSALCVISPLVQCTPTAKSWDPTLPGSCRDPRVLQGFAYMQGGLAISTAFLLSAFPVLIFRNLQMNRRTKVGLSLLMCLGIFDGICACVRTSLLPGYDSSVDYSYDSLPLETWGSLEQNIAIIAACIPVIRPLFRYFDNKPSYPVAPRNKTGYTMQKGEGSYPLVSQRTGTTDEEYGMTSYILSKPEKAMGGENGSERSEVTITNDSAIKKTTEINVEG